MAGGRIFGPSSPPFRQLAAPWVKRYDGRRGPMAADDASSLKGKMSGDSMTVRDVLEMLEADGWRLVVTRGSHRQFTHPTKPGRVTVAGKTSDDLPPGTLNSILKQSGLKR